MQVLSKMATDTVLTICRVFC